MITAFTLFEQHGLSSIFLLVLVEQLGAPIPAFPLLMLAGAKAKLAGLFGLQALGAAALAAVIADTAWFLIGRRYGRSVLSLLCRLSISPDTCVRSSEVTFERRGYLTIVLAKFIPGVSTLAPPLAGALRMHMGLFVLLDLLGAVLWAGSGLAAGFTFHDQVQWLINAMEQFGSAALLVVFGAIVGYVSWRIVRRGLVRRSLKVARLQPHQLAQLINEREQVLILDARSPDLLSPRIPTALRVPLNSDIPGPLALMSRSTRVVTYCDCPDDLSAALLAARLGRQGWNARVLEGGFRAWADAGLPIETA